MFYLVEQCNIFKLKLLSVNKDFLLSTFVKLVSTSFLILSKEKQKKVNKKY